MISQTVQNRSEHSPGPKDMIPIAPVQKPVRPDQDSQNCGGRESIPSAKDPELTRLSLSMQHFAMTRTSPNPQGPVMTN